NQVTGTHWYSTENAYWKSSAPYGIQIRNGHEGAIRGYLYADGTNFGLLSPDGSWKVRVNNSGTNVDGPLVVTPSSVQYFSGTYYAGTSAPGDPCPTLGQIRIEDNGTYSLLCYCARWAATGGYLGRAAGTYWSCFH
ncbi:MAG TPA: hypothetical protein VGQ83_20495, partial [Polyangia bacterium]